MSALKPAAPGGLLAVGIDLPVVETVGDEEDHGDTTDPAANGEKEEDTTPKAPKGEEQSSFRLGEDDDDEMPVIDVSDLLGRTFISEPDDDQVQARAKITGIHPADERDVDGSEELYRFKCSANLEIGASRKS